MCKKMICLLSLIVVLSLAGSAQALIYNHWLNATGNGLWSEPQNWSEGHVPAKGDDGLAFIEITPGPLLNEPVLSCHMFYLVATSDMTIDGSDVTTGSYCVVGDEPTAKATLYMKGGSLKVSGPLIVGSAGQGTLDMTGGSVEGAPLSIGWSKTAVGHLQLSGGTVTGAFQMVTDATVSVDIAAGRMILNGDASAMLQGYMDKGLITGYRGDGTLSLDYNVTNKGKTTLSATHMLNPSPADGSSIPVTVSELQWTLPEKGPSGGTVTCDLYFGTKSNFDDNPKVISRKAVNSYAVTLALDTTYYWAVDLYDSASATPNEPYMVGHIFTFTAKNQTPVVDAGKDKVTWLAQGQKVGNLAATVTDDGMPHAFTVAWTVVSEPNSADGSAAVIANPSAANTTVTLKAVGAYVLQAAAFDGELTGSDTITIKVYNSSCEAAQSLPNYVPLVGDLNGDCKVDDADLALLNANWLQDNSLTDDWFDVE